MRRVGMLLWALVFGHSRGESNGTGLKIGAAWTADSPGHEALLIRTPIDTVNDETARDSNQAGKKMEKTLLTDSRARRLETDVTPARGTGWGVIGGFVGTFVMDLFLMGALSAAGLPALTCFSIVGDTVASFFAIIGVQMVGGIPLGIAAHYLIGPAIGALFGAAVTKIDALRVDSLKKSIILAVLYVEILSQPLLATTPILLKMTAPETFQWYGVSFLMHLIAGAVLGLVIYFGLCSATKVNTEKIRESSASVSSSRLTPPV